MKLTNTYYDIFACHSIAFFPRSHVPSVQPLIQCTVFRTSLGETFLVHITQFSIFPYLLVRCFKIFNRLYLSFSASERPSDLSGGFSVLETCQNFHPFLQCQCPPRGPLRLRLRFDQVDVGIHLGNQESRQLSNYDHIRAKIVWLSHDSHQFPDISSDIFSAIWVTSLSANTSVVGTLHHAPPSSHIQRALIQYKYVIFPQWDFLYWQYGIFILIQPPAQTTNAALLS